ncbi:MAG TPA: peptidoglycan-binding domain-containing protein [Chthoniobacterales bacterium]
MTRTSANHGNLKGGRQLAGTHAAHAGLNRGGAHREFAHNYHVRPYRDVYHNYHAVYHDRGWYGAHYDRVVVVGGGHYYWDGGYWYPAWGYDPAVTVFAYSLPVYSYDNLPPDQVVVNVQTALQDQGYYTGDVDGQMGQQTRDAVSAYQRDHDLEVTSAVDEPTVDALGLNS